MSPNDRHSVTLIEDNEADVEAIRRGLRQLDDTIEINVLADGVEAKEYFLEDYSGKSPADVDVIFLDLNLPGVDGRQLLRTVQQNSGRMKTPIVVLTTSRIAEDVETTYQNGANGYIFKPNDWECLATFVQSACKFWFSLPPQ